MYFDHGVLVFKLPIGKWLQKLDMYFLRAKKNGLEKTVVTVLGYCLFFCNLIFPPKKWENISFGNFWKFVFVSCLQQSHTFPFFHSFISKHSHSHWCFTCGSINQPRQSHNKHIPGHPGFFWGEVQATLFCFKFPTFSVCLLDRTKTRTVPEWQVVKNTQALMHPGDVESATP